MSPNNPKAAQLRALEREIITLIKFLPFRTKSPSCKLNASNVNQLVQVESEPNPGTREKADLIASEHSNSRWLTARKYENSSGRKRRKIPQLI